jgi:hypothetical protein
MPVAWIEAMKQVLETGVGPYALRDHAPWDIVARSLSETVDNLRRNPIHPIEPGVLVREPGFLAQYIALAPDQRAPERLTGFDRPVLLALVAGGPCRLITRAGDETLRPSVYRSLAVGSLFHLEAQAESLILFVTGRAREGALVVEEDADGLAVCHAAPDRNVHRLYLLALAGRLGDERLRAEIEAFLDHEDAETRAVAARSITALDTSGAPHGA